MKGRDLYTVLGVECTATPEQIKAAHRKRARETHPDTNGSAGADGFRAVQHAAMVLLDPEKRARYDETGNDGSGPSAEQFLEACFDQCIDQIEPWMNPVGVMLEAMANVVAKLKADETAALEQVDRYGRTMALLRASGKAGDLLMRVPERRRDAAQRKADEARGTHDLAKSALALLKASAPPSDAGERSAKSRPQRHAVESLFEQIYSDLGRPNRPRGSW